MRHDLVEKPGDRDALAGLHRATREEERAGASLSGNERNRLFVNTNGRRFDDLSGISGADSAADGRAFAILDYDRDGWSDLALVNANAPLFQLFRNRIGERASGRMLAIELVGGNDRAQPSERWSARDGYGAEVTVDELRTHVGDEIGAIAKPKTIYVTPDLPKTRSGKIMRRLLRDVAEGRNIGDTTTLADASIVDELQARAAESAED